MKRIFINKDKCAGCLGCGVACMAEHNPAGKSVYDLRLSDKANAMLNNVQLDSAANPVPVFCRHCDDPACVRACMSGAMTKNPLTGTVDYDADVCAACFMCLMSCPFGVLKVDPATRTIIQKCDYCGDRGSPRCTDECPTGAIEFKEAES